ILAVVFTYFAITTSYIPLFIYHAIKNPQSVQQRQGSQNKGTATPSGTKATNIAADVTKPPRMSFGRAAFFLLLLAGVAPFLMLKSGFSGLISLFIIFIG